MVILNVIYTMKEGKKAADFWNELEETGLAPYCRTEKGNHRYQYFSPCNGENTLFLLENWEDDECLAAHMATENFAKIGAVKEKYVESVDLKKFYTE